MKSILLCFLVGLGLGTTAIAQTLEGIASYYGPNFHGKSTSTGETFDKNGYTCAAKVFPYGTILKVTNLENGRSTQVRVNDCGPHIAGRIVDLSEGAARQIDMLGKNLADVRVEVLSNGTDGPTCNRGAWSRGGRQAIDWTARQAEYAVQPEMTQGPGSAANSGNSSSIQQNTSPNPNASLSELLAARGSETGSENSDTRVSGTAILSPPPVAPTPENRSQTESSTTNQTSQNRPSTRRPSNTIDTEGPLYAVQLVAVRQRSNADGMIARLADAGFADAVVIKGGEFYRVFAQPVAFRAQAEYWKERLKEAGFDGIVRRIQ
ncbi:MAG: septal ring lytic transglycosylase RlpA family protein [Bacteroidota bacterium]